MGGYWSGVWKRGVRDLVDSVAASIPYLPWICSTPIPLLVEVLVNNNSRQSPSLQNYSLAQSPCIAPGPSSEAMAEVHKSSNTASKNHLCAAVCISVLPDGFRGSWTPAQTPFSHRFLSWLCAASLTPLYLPALPQ